MTDAGVRYSVTEVHRAQLRESTDSKHLGKSPADGAYLRAFDPI